MAPPVSPMNAPPRTCGMATASLVCGILGMVCLGPLAGIPAIILGHMARARTRRSATPMQGSGRALTGLILGYVSLAATVVVAIALLGAMVPALGAAASSAQKTQCRAEMMALTVALNQYEHTYGALPPTDNYNAMIGALTGKNPRGVVFLEAADGTCQDPWGRPFRVQTSYDGPVTVPCGDSVEHIAVWSCGPDGKGDGGGGDDITSWR